MSGPAQGEQAHGEQPRGAQGQSEQGRSPNAPGTKVQREELWRAWVDEACVALGVDPARVDIRAVLDLTRDIAHGVDRPMAPVGSFVLGLAAGAQGAEADLAALRAALRGTIPAQPLGVDDAREDDSR